MTHVLTIGSINQQTLFPRYVACEQQWIDIHREQLCGNDFISLLLRERISSVCFAQVQKVFHPQFTSETINIGHLYTAAVFHV